MELQEKIKSAILDIKDDLVKTSLAIHSHPELAFNEFQASKLLGDKLSSFGFNVERGFCDLETAFKATIGNGSLTVAICAEYDALPAIGHACGHNIIASSAIGAAYGLKSVINDIDVKVIIIGTPAEEGGGGKILLMQRGGFDGVDAAMMVHPAPIDAITLPCKALEQFDVHFIGKSSHASAAPHLGINALDAQIISQVSIGLLRQHLNYYDQVHGIITKGGDAANIIPEHTVSTYYIRSKSLKGLETLRPKVVAAFQGAAVATGATLNIIPCGPTYSELISDERLVECYMKASQELGRPITREVPESLSASTDMGNVSLSIPSIHPLVGIESNGSTLHQSEFANMCVGESADNAIIHGATAMALTTLYYSEMIRDDKQ